MRIICVVLSLCIFVQSIFPTTVFAANQVNKRPRLADTTQAGMHAAQILGIEGEVQNILQLKQQGKASPELLQLKASVLKKILLGSLEVTSACNKLDAELTYTYDVVRNQEAKIAKVNELFNLANFCQFGVLYSLEGKSRLEDKFPQSAILTCVSSGSGATLATLNVLFNKFDKANDVAPPKFMTHVFEGCSVADIDLPDIIDRFLDSPQPGQVQTCRQEMHELWKNRYGVHIKNEKTFGSLIDKRRQSIDELNQRILLLWSLHTYVQDFDSELLALLQLVKLPEPEYTDSPDPALQSKIGVTAYDAASLLNITPQVSALIRLNENNTNDSRRRILEMFVLEQILEAALERRVATDKVDEEINYANDVVLSYLLHRRARCAQLIYEANFIQAGTFGSIAGLLYLKKHVKAGDEMFVISSGIGTLLSTLSLLATHGGWRKRDSGPNSLATFMNLEPQGQFPFPPVVSRYLNTPDPLYSTHKTRRDELYDIWKQYKVSTMNMDKQKNRQKVAGMPNCKFDTIRIVTNRVHLLRSIVTRIEGLDCELVDLIQATTPSWLANRPKTTVHGTVVTTADLIGARALVEEKARLEKDNNTANMALVDNSLALTRIISGASLEARSTISHIDLEISKQSQHLERLSRARNMTVAMINNLNFFQINILGMIIDGPLGLSGGESYQKNDDRLTIVSGIMGFCLGCAAFLAQHGGFRLKKAEPNVLAACFNLDSPANDQYLPLLLRFLNVVGPDSPNNWTRRQELVEYWKRSKLLSVNVENPTTQQKLAVIGPKHHRWDENIKLIRNRLTMLFDLKTTVNLLDVGLTDILHHCS